MIHELKTDAESYDAIIGDHKRCEVRFNDRRYAVGDILRLLRYADGQWTPNEVLAVTVTHILQGADAERYGLKPGYVAMSIEAI